MAGVLAMTNRPEWKLVYATDYSALYVDTTGVYDPELAIAQTRGNRTDREGLMADDSKKVSAA